MQKLLSSVTELVQKLELVCRVQTILLCVCVCVCVYVYYVLLVTGRGAILLF